MRVTTHNAFQTSVANLQKRQQAMVESQAQLTSGKRVLRPSDDPAAAAAAERALAAASRAEVQQRALDASRNAMTLTESALGDAGELLAQIRERMISAGNASYSDRDRASLAQAMRALRDDLLAVANRNDGAGRFLFGGQGSDRPPLVDAPGGVVYAGTSGEMQAASGESSPLAIDGRAVWLQAPDPRNPGNTLSLFDTLDRVVGELSTPGRSGPDIAATVRDGLAEIDAGAANLSAWRARAGEALNRIDGISERLAQTRVDAQRERSEAEDLDMVAAIADFQNRQSGYDAALKTYSLVQRMSLFDYLR